jgi:uncharacterized protein (DUF1501 family)
MSIDPSFRLGRRATLLGLTAAFTLGRSSLALAHAVTEKRLVIVLLRGALDGLSAVQPYGDPDFSSLRGPLALPQPGQPGGLLDLGWFYGLHPKLANLHAMYAAGDATILHAVAGHYRSRSHFEAQDFLESGADQRLDSGWLNRAVAELPATPGQDLALTVGLSTPLILRGHAEVAAWAPEHIAQPQDEFYARVMDMTARDSLIGPAVSEGIRRRGLAVTALAGQPVDPKHDHSFAALMGSAGRLLASPTGPRVAALEITGWDTHAGQLHRLDGVLSQLDDGFGALKSGLGPAAWRHTTVLAVTEFGRTAHINGTGGTDHGTGAAAFLVGGAVAGGRVRADWPGLGSGKLFEARDLAPTTDLRGVIKGVLAAHLGLSNAALARVYPGSDDAPPINGLIRA